jgi:hypothetical protein
MIKMKDVSLWIYVSQKLISQMHFRMTERCIKFFPFPTILNSVTQIIVMIAQFANWKLLFF